MRLEQEFEKVKFNIKLKNYLDIIEKLKTFFIDLELSSSGLLLQNDKALEMAHQAFCQAKKTGKIDELNFLCERG